MSAPPVKDRLLDAAINCLQRQGFAHTSARDLAREAQANLRSIGYHYGSTQGLLLAALSANWRRWLAPLIQATEDAEQPPRERVQLGMDAFARTLADNAPMVRAWLEAVVLAREDTDLRARLAANQSEFRAALARTLMAADQPDSDARAAALITICDGILTRYLLHGETAHPAEIAQLAATALAPRSGD
jgi:AcrR family transcriptional regulator